MIGTGPHRGFAFVEYHTKEDAKVRINHITSLILCRLYIHRSYSDRLIFT